MEGSAVPADKSGCLGAQGPSLANRTRWCSYLQRTTTCTFCTASFAFFCVGAVPDIFLMEFAVFYSGNKVLRYQNLLLVAIQKLVTMRECALECAFASSRTV